MSLRAVVKRVDQWKTLVVEDILLFLITTGAPMMRGWVTNYSLRAYVIFTLLCLHPALVSSLKKENRCMRHYFVETIRHPNKVCESKVSHMAVE